MYDESQSFIARFSGFFLFLIALLVVGFLVFLTVRSAQDTDGDGELAVTTSEAVVSEDGSIQSDSDQNQSATVNSETQASDDEGVVATPDDDIGLTTDDNTVAAASDSDTDGSVASDTAELANTGGDEADLPNTGPAESALTVAVLGLIGALGYNFFRSQREFSQSLLRK